MLKLYCKKLTDPFSLYLPQSWLNCSNVRKIRLLSLLESISNEKWKAGKKADTACFKSFPFIAFENWDLRVLCMVLSHKILNTAVWVSLAAAAANSYIKGENEKVHRGHFSCYVLNALGFSLIRIFEVCIGHTPNLLGLLFERYANVKMNIGDLHFFFLFL